MVASPTSPAAQVRSLADVLPSLLLLPILSGLLYFIGHEYYQARLNSFGIEASLFPLSIDQAIYNGFTASVLLLVEPVVYGVIVVMALMASVLLLTLLTTSSFFRNARDFLSLLVLVKFNIKKFRLQEHPPPSMIKATDKVSIIYSFSLIAFLLIVFILVAAVFSSKLGREQANKAKENWKLEKTPYILLMPSAGAPFRALQVQCNDKHCAFWNGESSEIYRLDQISKITAFPATSK